jgi:hypothetical protein
MRLSAYRMLGWAQFAEEFSIGIRETYEEGIHQTKKVGLEALRTSLR